MLITVRKSLYRVFTEKYHSIALERVLNIKIKVSEFQKLFIANLIDGVSRKLNF